MVGYVGDDVHGPDAYAAGSPDLYRELVDKANAASEDDYILSYLELERFIESLVGGDITSEQARILINIYSQGGNIVYTDTVVERMTSDGFLMAVPGDHGFGSLKWGIDWNNIDGTLIADALYRGMGLDASVPMTAEQFDEAIDRLFGYTSESPNFGQSVIGVFTGLFTNGMPVLYAPPEVQQFFLREDAAFLARAYGTHATLNRDQIAGLFEHGEIQIDGVAGEKYIRIDVKQSETRAVLVSNDAAADYIMKFDGNDDGWLNSADLQAAINSRLEDGGQGVGDDIMTQYMIYYGEKGGGGDMVVNRDDIMAMLNDTSLYLGARGTEGGNGFGVNLNITPIERVLHGYSYLDPESLNDGVLSEHELVALSEKLQVGLTPEQAAFLIDVYGDGTYMNQADVQRMRDDGFLMVGTGLGEGGRLDWSAIDGVLLARAVFWAAGVDPNVEGATLTPEQFNAGLYIMFQTKHATWWEPAENVHSPDDGKFLTKIFGAQNLLTVDQMAAVFDSPTMEIIGESGKKYVTLHSYTDRAELTTVQQQTNYLMSFDADNTGVLSEGELLSAIQADKNDHQNTFDDKIIHRLALVYGTKQDDGTYVFESSALDLMASEGVLLALPNTTGNANVQGLSIHLDLIPTSHLVDAMFRQANKNPMTDTLTAAELDIQGTDQIFGDWQAIREQSAKDIAYTFGTTGTTDANGVSTMSRGDVMNVFNSGVITREPVGDRSILPIKIHYDRLREWIPKNAVRDPNETFSVPPDRYGRYYTTSRYSDGTEIRMEYARSGDIRKGAARFNVVSAQITTLNPDNVSPPYVTTITYNWKNKTYTALPGSNGVNVSLSNITDAVVLIYPDGSVKRFSMNPNKPFTYNFHSPIEPNSVLLLTYPVTDDPADDVSVVSSRYTYSGTVDNFDGRTTADVFEVTMSDGLVIKVEIHYSMFRTRAMNQQMAEQFAAKFGKLPPALRQQLSKMKLGVEYLDLTLQRTYRGYFFMGQASMVIPQEGLLFGDAFFQSIVLHEMGHAVDLDIPSADWRTAMNADGFSVSQYSKTLPQEDFAETYYAWYLVRTGMVDPAVTSDLESKFANRFWLLDRSASARNTLPPEKRPEVDFVRFPAGHSSGENG